MHNPIHTGPAPPYTGRGPRWRVLLAWIAFAAPCWWAARSLLEGVPALLMAAVSPYTLASVFYRADGVVARVFPPGAVTDDYRPGMSAALRDPLGVSLVFGVAFALIALKGRDRMGWFRFPVILTAALVVLALLQPLSGGFGGRAGDPLWLRWGMAAAGLALAYPVFRALALETGIANRAMRIAATTVMLLSPALAFAALQGRGGWGFSSLQGLLVALPFVLLAAGLAALPRPTKPMPLRLAAGGVVASIALLLVGTAPRQTGFARTGLAPEPVPAAMANAPYPKLFFQRGVSFTSEWPDSYESPKAHELLRKLRDRGVDAVALVPYASSSSTSPELRHGHWERDDAILALAATAHQLGMRVMLKPQVWFRGSYPGDFDLADDTAREVWLAEYERFALHHAELARRAHADLYCVGTEFAKLTRHQAYWRQLIAKIRKVYPGPLTYAANFGQEFEALAFWDELDYIGLNNYYPLPDSLNPAEVVAKVEAVHQRFGKPILFTEGGYSSYAGGYRQPWAENNGPVDLEMQAKAYDAVLAAFWEKPWFYGAYWWKIGSNSFGGPLDRSHTPWGKPAMAVVSRWYGRTAPGRTEYPAAE
jgi:hypothetical protein